MQLELIPLESPSKPVLQLSDVPYGTPVRRNSSGTIIMRVKATGFLLNSTLIADIIHRDDCLIVDLAKGTMYSVAGHIPVTLLKNPKLHYQLPL